MRTRRFGFTLIELLIVVVIIGILAGIAIPKFSSAKEKTYIAAMTSDLRNLTTAQETYFQDWQTYASASNLGLVGKNGTNTWRPSTGVVLVPSGTAGVTSGWNAQVARPGTTVTCSVWVGTGGTGAFMGSGQQQGDVTCY
jgi:type IV pilus assembly protein PilA